MFSAYCRYRESSPWKQRKYHQKAKDGKSTTKYLKLKNPDKAINQAPTEAAGAGQAGQVKTGVTGNLVARKLRRGDTIT